MTDEWSDELTEDEHGLAEALADLPTLRYSLVLSQAAQIRQSKAPVANEEAT